MRFWQPDYGHAETSPPPSTRPFSSCFQTCLRVYISKYSTRIIYVNVKHCNVHIWLSFNTFLVNVLYLNLTMLWGIGWIQVIWDMFCKLSFWVSPHHQFWEDTHNTPYIYKLYVHGFPNAYAELWYYNMWTYSKQFCNCSAKISQITQSLKLQSCYIILLCAEYFFNVPNYMKPCVQITLHEKVIWDNLKMIVHCLTWMGHTFDIYHNKTCCIIFIILTNNRSKCYVHVLIVPCLLSTSWPLPHPLQCGHIINAMRSRSLSLYTLMWTFWITVIS